MKRFAIALPLAAASVLFCLPAFAADAAPTGELQKDMAGKHLAIMIAAVLLPVLVKFFGNETLHLPYWAAKLRVAVVILLGGSATVADQIQNGGEVWSAVTAAIMTTAPALLIELLQKFGGGGEVAGQRAKSVRPSAMIPPPVLCLALALVVLPGCAALQNVKTVVRDVAAEVFDDAAQANTVLDVLHSVVEVFFLASPDAATQAQVEQYFADARLAVESAMDVAKGANAASGADYNAAFGHFREAYSKLMTVLNDLGIVGKTSSGKMSVNRRGGGTNEIPVPRAAMMKAAK
jgi:hypothetical protein